ncbi:hypothetical protein Xhom_02709 [Xenorhabdus hominickii]|uniref:Uncharacterized protein n=1 Tax=Xenorhabdus hominickii TaxID=351679 RepID=A0A2G0Q6A0_XENHO|nr:hypothetical protein Xhom_02709 [Xenorhabdus hominickii]
MSINQNPSQLNAKIFIALLLFNEIAIFLENYQLDSQRFSLNKK